MTATTNRKFKVTRTFLITLAGCCCAVNMIACGSLLQETERIANRYEELHKPREQPKVEFEAGEEAGFVGWYLQIVPKLSGGVRACSISPALPAGLTLRAADCAIIGTPTQSIPETVFTLHVSFSGAQLVAQVRLRIFRSEAESVYGQPDFITGTANLPAENSFASPTGIMLGTNGLFFADRAYNRVLYIENGQQSASLVLGQPDFFTEVTPVTPNIGSLRLPQAVALDRHGRLWIADTANHRILRYSLGASQADGLIGHNAYNIKSAGNCAATGLDSPSDIVTDESGIYVSDTGHHRVLYFATLAPGTAEPAATRVYGQSDFVTCGPNSNGLSAGTLAGPTGLALSTAGLFIADTLNHRVLFIPHGAATAQRVYGQPDFATNAAAASPTGLQSPMSVAFAPFGVFIVDKGNHRILYYRRSETVASVVLGQGADFSSAAANFGGISAASLYGPSDIAIGENLYISDSENHRLLKY